MRAVVAVAGVLWWLMAVGVDAQRQFQVYASIVDDTGGPASNVLPSDVRVLENGVEAAVISVEKVNIPVKLQLLVDNGVGLGSDNIAHLRNGVRGLLEALPLDMEVTFVVTGGQPRFLVRPTTDRAAILKGVDLLAPDRGAGKFVEALTEAAVRIERDKGNYTAVIVAFGTTAGDLNVLERDVEQLVKRLRAHPTTVHVVLLSLVGSTSTVGGQNQTNVGIGVTEITGGRFTSLAAPNRLATLLPEIGLQVAKVHELQRQQFKITVDRPAGASGELGEVSISAFGGLGVESVSFDGRVRD
ncbi:MAG TPA: VWA domain-containing protein [Vicinamibacterales bacterium]|nr:VWA domain-containing protein [Vicinamibacterales bacterium]